jgi:hypothetical protein
MPDTSKLYYAIIFLARERSDLSKRAVSPVMRYRSQFNAIAQGITPRLLQNTLRQPDSQIHTRGSFGEPIAIESEAAESIENTRFTQPSWLSARAGRRPSRCIITECSSRPGSERDRSEANAWVQPQDDTNTNLLRTLCRSGRRDSNLTKKTKEKAQICLRATRSSLGRQLIGDLVVLSC